MRQHQKLRRTGVTMIAVAGMALAVPAVASAAPGTVGMTGSTLVFQGGPATTNAVTIAKVALGVPPRTFSFVRDTGPGATIEVGTGCAAQEGGNVVCGDPAVAPGGVRWSARSSAPATTPSCSRFSRRRASRPSGRRLG